MCKGQEVCFPWTDSKVDYIADTYCGQYKNIKLR